VTIHVVLLDATALVCADCALDTTATADLHRVLDNLVAAGPATVLLDLVEVPMVDDGAVAVLAAAATRLAYQGAELELRLPGGRALAVPDARTLRQALRVAYPLTGQADPTN